MPNTSTFCQWDSKSIEIPIVQIVNHDFEVIMDSIFEVEKKCISYTDSSDFLIHITKLPKDTATLYIHIWRPFSIGKELCDLESQNIAFTKYKNNHCYIAHDGLPNKLFNSTDNYKTYICRKYKQSKKREKNQQIVITSWEEDGSYWKYHFAKNKFSLYDSLIWCE